MHSSDGNSAPSGDAHDLHEPLLNGNSNTNDEYKDQAKSKETPYATAGLYSRIFFSWIQPLISLGNTKTLDFEDVPEVTGADSVRGAFPIFESKLILELDGSKVTTFMLAKALFATAWKEFLLSGFYFLIYTLSTYVGPVLINTLVQYLNGHQQFDNEGCILVLAFLGAKVVESLANKHYSFKVQQAGVRARAALVEKVYTKGLTLSFHAKKGRTSGEIINIMAVDAESISNFLWFFHELWMVGPQVFLALLILYKNLGLASLAALASTIIVMLINLPLGNLQTNFQQGLMKSKDKRMKTTTEVLRNMRILKLQAWETKFLARIQELRETEAGWLKKILYTKATTSFVFWGAPGFVSAVTFGACLLLGIPLTTGKILSALATFRILQVPINTLPSLISVLVQTRVSLNRIATFLSLDDLPSDAIEKLPSGTTNMAIEIIDGNFSWDDDATWCLRDINVSISVGMRVAICGSVGSGKSSLLSCILGEMPKLSGRVKLCGKKTYVAQSPWIQSGTIQENILFGKLMDKEKYDCILEACSFNKDLEILSFGDQTIIGERGINLSGGQKQRLQIARALYQDADVYLFDDPFSAVDAHTGTHLFKECILGLLSHKTIVYVTHQVEFLPAADLILVVKDGKVTQTGKYDDILLSGTDFMELVGAHREALSVLDPPIDQSLASSSSSTSVGTEDGSNVHVVGKEETQNDDNVVPKAQIVEEEEKMKGKVELLVYWKYLTMAYGGALVPLILLGHALFQALEIGSNYWMSWATPVSDDVASPVLRSTLIIVYVSLVTGASLCILFRSLLLATAGYKTATLLFHKMLSRIFRAPMSFFDATPSGRILNRASTDQSEVDLILPDQAGNFAFSLIQLVGIVAVMAGVAWEIIIVFIPALVFCILIQQYIMSSTRELSRLIAVSKSPIIQHFSETISGSSTIRSFDQEPRFQDMSMKLIDAFSHSKFHRAAAMEWLAFRLDILSLSTFTCLLVFLVLILPNGTIDPALAGLAVTYALNLSMLQDEALWYFLHLENKIISVERILQYMNIPCEPPLVVETNKPNSQWPSQGEIDISDLKVRYAPHMPLVLRGLSCTFFGGKRTGIVGRTGCGKSTLMQTLFRIVDPVGGQIKIDGIDISTIGLHDLRSRLSIIPQDPTMFEGTMRMNLDPLEEHTNEQIWEALDKCQLGDEVRKREGELDSTVSENGENWSVGQRQLVCLGRVLLKKSKILVLDEATASVDTATDNLIQQTLRKHFINSTVITIAHRITSVLDSDMVLLMENGVIEEYDAPSKLLEKTSSFSKLVAEYSTRASSSSS